MSGFNLMLVTKVYMPSKLTGGFHLGVAPGRIAWSRAWLAGVDDNRRVITALRYLES